MVWFGPRLAWLLASSSTAVSCRATVSPLRRLRRNCRAALLHGCTAAPICCAAPAAAVTACCRTAPPSPFSFGSLLRPRRSAAAVLLPPQPLCYCRAAPLHCRVAPLRAAPRHSATCCQLCTAPPRCCRAASLLPRRFATATQVGGNECARSRLQPCTFTTTTTIEDPLRKATQARFPSPLSNCLVCRCNSY